MLCTREIRGRNSPSIFFIKGFGYIRQVHPIGSAQETLGAVRMGGWVMTHLGGLVACQRDVVTWAAQTTVYTIVWAFLCDDGCRGDNA